jgi:hypothetical protein
MANIKPPIRSLEDIEENLREGDSLGDEASLQVKPRGVGKASDLRRGIPMSEEGQAIDRPDLEERTEDPLDDEEEILEVEVLKPKLGVNLDKESLNDEEILDEEDAEEELKKSSLDDEIEELGDLSDSNEKELDEDIEKRGNWKKKDESEYELEKPMERLSQDEAFQKGVFGEEEDPKTDKFSGSSHRRFSESLDSFSEEQRAGTFDKPNPYRNFEEEDMEDASMHIPNLRSRNMESQIPSRVSSQNFPPPKNMNQERPSFSPSYNGVPRRRGISKFHVLLLIVIGLVVIGATVYLLKNQFKNNLAFLNKATPTPQATSEPTAVPSPTTAPVSLDRTKFKIRVLNGTPTTGLAASVAAKLKEVGYQQDKVGNASNSSFLKTQVKVKPGNNDLADQLIKDLSDKFSAVLSGDLKDSDAADGEVIIGKE